MIDLFYDSTLLAYFPIFDNSLSKTFSPESFRYLPWLLVIINPITIQWNKDSHLEDTLNYCYFVKILRNTYDKLIFQNTEIKKL